MAIKAVEMVRQIRNKHYDDTKGLAVKDQIKSIKEKSERLKKELKKYRQSVLTSSAAK